MYSICLFQGLYLQKSKKIYPKLKYIKPNYAKLWFDLGMSLMQLYIYYIS